MKQIIFRMMTLSSLFLALLAMPAARAVADDEADEIEIKVQARLEAVDCAATPPTITVLGLTIDISKAGINSSDDLVTGTLTCADLAVGQIVEVKLVSDVPSTTTGLLSALEVDID